MVSNQWSDFFAKWEAELRALPEPFQAGDPFPIPPERSEQAHANLAQLEARLGRELPSSYRDYLLLSAGLYRGYALQMEWAVWRREHSSLAWMNQEIERVISDEIELEEDGAKTLTEADLEELNGALVITDGWDEPLYLLNPKVVTAEGEWEAWRLSPNDLFLTRFPTFRDLMEAQFAEFQERIVGCKLAPVKASARSMPRYPWKELLAIWGRALTKPGVREFFNLSREACEDNDERQEMIAERRIT